MSNRAKDTRIARAIQKIGLDELGVRYGYTSCLKLVREQWPVIKGMKREEAACLLHETHKSVLTVKKEFEDVS